MPAGSFYGVIQGLSKDQIIDTMSSSAINTDGYSLESVSPFKKIGNIIEIHKEDLLEEFDIKKSKKKKSIDYFGIDAIFHAGGEEATIVLILIILAVIGIFLFWAFILIPLLIIILSLITAGRIWKMFRIYFIVIYPRKNIDYERIANDIYFKGGALSKSWLMNINSPEIMKRDYEIRNNYLWVKKSQLRETVHLRSYSIID